MMRVAGIDCGTNSIRLLIANYEDGKLTDIVRRMEVARLGQGVDRTGMFDPQALQRTLDFVSEYAELCKEHGVESIRFAATSATRDAANREEFLSGVLDLLGVQAQVLSGQEEARASFNGATSVLPAQEPPLLTVDLGGGSTEFVLGTSEGNIIAAASVDIGCVRMRERHLHSDPASAQEVANAREDVRAALRASGIDFSSTGSMVGLAGTVTTITAKVLGLEEYDADAIHGSRVDIDEFKRACQWFIDSGAQERAKLGFLHPGRSDVIAAGALIWQEILSHVQESSGLSHTLVSEYDILDGLTLWAATEINRPSWA